MGSLGLILEIQYDATSLLGVPVYFNKAGFPATLEANLPGAANNTFKTSATRKSYQSNTD
jgi:hypothetical protein